MASRSRLDARRNRAAILDAAATEIGLRGELNMARLASAAGLSRSTLHRHFPRRSDLLAALRERTIAEVRAALADTAEDEGPALAVLRRAIAELVALGGRHRPQLVGAFPVDGPDTASVAAHLAERLRGTAGLQPVLPAPWVGKAVGHLVNACLRAGEARPDETDAAAELLFRALAEPLDRGLVLVDGKGTTIARNARAAALAPADGNLVFADGSPCPPDAHPVALAARTGESQNAVIGRVEGEAGIRWLSVEARVLRSAETEPPYGVAGVIEDVSTERDWELERLRPPGELAAAAAVPLDIARVLDEIPPHLFPEQFVSEARRISGGPVAMYVLDIDGTHLLRLAGPEEFPDRLSAPLALGPELADDGIPALRARLEGELPGVSVAPMWLRGRAIGVLLALRTPEEPLVELGRHGAAAMELAGGYTDVFDIARRRKETHAAAELQQSLLPPRIARLGGGEIAGSVLPAYEVGGDWFDYVENRDGAWIAIADAVGKGATAGALGGIALAALRAARRDEQSLEATARTMHEVVFDVGRPEFYVTAIVARWHAVYSTMSWVNCGHPPPLVARADGTIEQLFTEPGLPLGLMERERRFVPRQRRLEQDERLILHSDGITARKTGDGLFGLDGIERALRGADSRSAPAMARAIQEAVLSASEDKLQDDAVAIVLAPRDTALDA